MSITDLRFYGLSGTYKGRTYTDVAFNPTENTRRGLIFPPTGGIFEVKYPNFDIIGSAN